MVFEAIAKEFSCSAGRDFFWPIFWSLFWPIFWPFFWPSLRGFFQFECFIKERELNFQRLRWGRNLRTFIKLRFWRC